MRNPSEGQRQHGQPRRRLRDWAALAVIAAVTAAVAVIAAVTHAGHPAAPAATVTLAVSGSPADVTWGPAGSSLQGTVPMSEVMPLGTPLYYAISAQLTGDGGSVTCQISVGGAVISRATAAGAYRLAMCEISRDPLTGQWAAAAGG